jgi:hypothetical protein
MTALDPASAADTGGLAALAGLEMAAGQLAPLITVLRAEQGRRKAGIAISRPAWKNLVFTGGPGTGKLRAAARMPGTTCPATASTCSAACTSS